jgi:anaerobic magnesium-protoporphyrin IX monomethyl ester cyclase
MKKTRIDLLLVNPGNRSQVFQSLGNTLSAIEPPIWAGLIATFVRNHGFSVGILDANAEGLTFEETAQQIADINPILSAIVVYGHQPSASTQNMPACGQVCSLLKQIEQEIPILMVGGHVAALPGRTLMEENVDFVCDGEGPYTIVELLHALKAKVPDYSKVRGLWYREEGKPRPPKQWPPLVADLDAEMSGMAWDLLPMEKYRAHNWHCFGNLQREPYSAIYTTLGCPFRCSFCCIQAPFKTGERATGLAKKAKSYRLWNPHSVIQQIGILVEQYNVRNLKIADEIFVLNPRHVLDLCDLIKERGYDLNIWAYARLDTIKEGMLDRLKNAGVNWLAFGIEAASERVRDEAHKGYGQEKIRKTIEAVRAAGTSVIGNYIFGLPEDDLSTMQATLDLALELNCEFVNLYCAMAYPGSQLYETAISKGWPLPEDWSGYSQYSINTLPLPTNYLSPAEVLRFRDNAFHTYFSSPRYLEMVSRKFGSQTVQHISEMISHRIERRFA